VTSGVNWGNSHSSKPLPKATTRKGCAKGRDGAEASHNGIRFHVPSEKLRALILRQIERSLARTTSSHARVSLRWVRLTIVDRVG